VTLGAPATTAGAAVGAPSVAPHQRIESIDLLRGLVMILMALDHTRDFFGVPGVNPTDPATASPALFFTRWITHICAPVFFLLTGTGASLSRARTSTAALAWYLFTRGLWLIVLELTIVRGIAYQFNFDYRVTMLLVLWALGWAMMVLAGLVFLPAPFIAVIGIVMIAGHNLLDPIPPTNPIWAILHGPGFVLQGERTVFAAYPLVPWIGVTALGFALGSIYRWPPDRRRRLLRRAGIGCVVGFVVLRWANVYGDPVPWLTQATPGRTLMSFLNATKYPPSLLFLLMTLGPALLLLRWMDGRTPRRLRPALEYGRAPLFYFVAHFTVIHALAATVCLMRYGTARWMFESPTLGQYPFTPPPGWGYWLPIVYVVWILVVVSLYPACRAVARAKARRAHSWLSYV
jgi:uncharacterized membrane protein